MRRILKYYKIWLPLLSIVIFFSIVELICRSFSLTDKLDADFKFYIQNVDDDLLLSYNVEDAYLMWFPKPDYTEGGIKINSQGFRDKEYNIKKDKNVFRILCLGDSSTFGFGVQLQDTYHSLLEDRLNEEFGHSGTRFEVINAGVTGYTSSQGLGLYKHKGFKYTPDIVTFYFGINEPTKRFSLSDRQIMHRDIPAAVKAAMENNLLLKLHSYRIFRRIIFNVFAKGKDNMGKNVERVSLEDFKKNISELNESCKKNGASLVLISFPFSKEKYSEGNLRKRVMEVILYREELEKASKEFNLPLISIPEMMEKSPLDTGLFFLDAVHPNPLGHRKIMEKLNNYLLTNKVLPANYYQ